MEHQAVELVRATMEERMQAAQAHRRAVIVVAARQRAARVERRSPTSWRRLTRSVFPTTA